MDSDKEETVALGGNIELVGFRDLDGASLVIVKKVVGNYARKISEVVRNVEKLKLSLKPVHKTESSQVNELHAQLIFAGKQLNASETDRNLFFAIDRVLKKIEAEASKFVEQA